MILLPSGFLVDTAADGSQALAAVGRREPDVVLMDLRMPGSDGAEAMIGVRAHAPSAEIVVFSTYSDSATKKLLEEQGVFRYLVKGVSAEAILQAVSQALEHKRSWWHRGRRRRRTSPSSSSVRISSSIPGCPGLVGTEPTSAAIRMRTIAP